MLPERTKVSYEEFLSLNQADERLEYIEGEVCLLVSPSVEHQRTLLNIAFVFKSYFKRKSCEPFIAPLDLILRKEEEGVPHHVQPDIMVICDK
ncbi:Restriction endonuclease type II-like [Acididesulfobacillus acetoxydans]|uniref:Restriction endonuclease type II-like n=1 Tax=Acididesulfobacillus acetoxydans TaxID=1561005 RepID=A0A8S0W7C1_9FIRM|nr:Restriction endonuclease type II-like [Acididesulfobacillus acetoxydans]CEJ06703.1 Restriction endonuclease type II-like [Acididesulfobacillus acetoxydans]